MTRKGRIRCQIVFLEVLSKEVQVKISFGNFRKKLMEEKDLSWELIDFLGFSFLKELLMKNVMVEKISLCVYFSSVQNV